MLPGHVLTQDNGVRVEELARATGLEPAASCVTGRRSNQLNYAPVTNHWSCSALHCPRAAWLLRVTLPRNALGCNGIRLTNREVDKRLAEWFFERDPQKGKSENHRVFTGDLNGGPGGLEPPTSPLSVLRSLVPRLAVI